jgi:hypothetical protein
MNHPLIYALIAVAVAIAIVAGRYFFERSRQKKIDATGTVLYATLLYSEPVKVFGKLQADFVKMTMRLQRPGETEAREVTMSTRIPANQRLEVGMKIPVVLDPRKENRVYPASADSAKRAIMTGSRDERRMMQQQMRSPGRGPRQQNTGYIPPNMGGRRR